MTTARWQGTLSRLARPAALTMAALAVAALVLDMVVVLTFPASVPSFDATRLSSLAPAMPEIPLAVVVTVLALRRPTNPAGWLLGSSCSSWFFSPGLVPTTCCTGSTARTYRGRWSHRSPSCRCRQVRPRSSRSQPCCSSFQTVTFCPSVGGASSGSTLSWLPSAAVPPLFDPSSIGDGHRQLPNPLGVAGAHPLLNAVSTVAELATFAMAAVGLVSLGIRYRRAGSDVRQQIKWFGAGVVVLLVAVLVGSFTSPTVELDDTGSRRRRDHWVLRPALVHRSGGAEVPPVRHRRRHQPGPGVRLAGGADHRGVRGHRGGHRRAGGQRRQAQPRPLHPRHRDRGGRLPAGPRAAAEGGQPAGVRQARHPLRGAQ